MRYSQTAFASALAPLAQRMAQTVREHEILRIAGQLAGGEPTTQAARARNEVLRWAERRCGGRFPREAWDFNDFEYLAGGRNNYGVRLSFEDTDVWAIRTEDPDQNVAGRTWTTEVVIATFEGNRPRFSARLIAYSPERMLDVEPHTPGFVRQLSEHVGLIIDDDARASSESAIVSSEAEAQELIEYILESSRTIPVFVFSEGNSKTQYLISEASKIAASLTGIARIYIVQSAYTWSFDRSIW